MKKPPSESRVPRRKTLRRPRPAPPPPQALERKVDVEGQTRILELFGTLDWDESYDYKAARGRN